MQRQRLKDRLAELAQIMRKEESRISYLSGERRGGVIVVRRNVSAAFVGDIHGDIETLRVILKRVELEISGEDILVFLGDYIDRGPPEGQVGALLELAELKMSMGERLILLRGNHEVMRGLVPYPHDYPLTLRSLYGEEWLELYDLSLELFDSLPHALVLNGFLALHGGPPTKEAHDLLEYLAYDRRADRMEEILYNDPYEMAEREAPSPRGAGRLWGMPVTEYALGLSGTRLIVRGHEAVRSGYKMNHMNKVLTLFSRKGAPYYNEKAAYAVCSPEDEDPLRCVRTL